MIRLNVKLLSRDKINYIALSGGVDSIAATHFLFNNFNNFNLKIIHINHNYIVEDLDIAKSVGAFCNQYGYPLININTECKDSNGKEADCREARIKSFSQLENANVILAHHLDDAVESYLMNCFKGDSEYLPLPFKTDLNNNTQVVRPFLQNRKVDFIAYCENNNLMQFVYDDPLNKESRRGWIREKLLPVIEEQYKGLGKVVWKRYIQRGY